MRDDGVAQLGYTVCRYLRGNFSMNSHLYNAIGFILMKLQYMIQVLAQHLGGGGECLETASTQGLVTFRTTYQLVDSIP